MLLVWYTHLGVPLPEAGLHAVDLIAGGQTLAEETNKMKNLSQSPPSQFNSYNNSVHTTYVT